MLVFRDVKDRTVLKVYETDVQGVPPSPSRSPKVRGSRSSAMYNSGHESDSSTRSAPAGVPRSPLHHHRQYNDVSIQICVGALANTRRRKIVCKSVGYPFAKGSHCGLVVTNTDYQMSLIVTLHLSHQKEQPLYFYLTGDNQREDSLHFACDAQNRSSQKH